MFQLKVFTGPQQDATIELESGVKYSIANNLSADIFLEESNIYELVEFMLLDNGIEFYNLNNQELFLKDQEVVTASNSYPLPAFFSSGAIKFAIFNSDKELTSWENDNVLDAPSENLLKADEESEGFIHDIEKASEATARENEFGALDGPIQSEEMALETTKRNSVVTALHNFKLKAIALLKYLHNEYKLKFYIALGIIFLLFLIITSAVVLIHKNNLTTTLNQNALDQTRNIKKRFAELPNKFANLSIKQGTNYFVINGLVYDDNDLQELKQYFKDYPGLINFQVLTVSNADAKIRKIVSVYHLTSFSINYDKASQELNISGITTGDATEINDIQIEISNQLAGVPNLQFYIYNKQQIFQDFNNTLGLDSNHLELQESYDLVKPKYLISGYLTASQLNNLTESVNTLREKYKTVCSINLDIKNSLSALPFKIYSVFTGSPGYIITLDGDIVYVGGELGGFKLVSISDKKIVFSGKLTLEVPLSQINDNSANTMSFLRKPLETRDQILNDEYAKVKNTISQEQKQLNYLKQYYAKIDDSSIKAFILNQINALNSDLELKQKDLTYYSKVINPA